VTSGGGGALVSRAGGIAGVAGAVFGAEVLQPAKSARDNAAMAVMASIVRLSKNTGHL
jgi:hypothetical protein